jgi:hypothetical protein
MPGRDPGIHRAVPPWIAGSSPAMTKMGGFRDQQTNTEHWHL